MKQKHGSERHTDTEIIQCFERHKMLSKMSAELGLPEVTIWRRCKKLGLEFKNGGYKEKCETQDILSGKHPHFQTNKLRKRLIKENILENKCSVCGISTWNDNPITLQLDHIDGNNKNHILKNIRLICPNCHSQTETYCGRNK
jgi:hypothetical protein